MPSQHQASIAPDLTVFMNYEYEAELHGDNAVAYTIELAEANKKTLELGAGAGMITKHLTKTKGCDVVALEINPAAIQKLRAYVDRIYSLDLNDPRWIDGLASEGKFDTIVAADVLEHLFDPWSVLRNMKKLLSDKGSIILSLPHVAHSALIACLLEEDFEYREWGLLDKTHIRFFGLHNIQALHASAGLAVTDARFVIRDPEETEFADRWARLPKNVQKALLSNPYGRIYQVITRATLMENALPPIDLFKVAAKRCPPRPATLFEKVASAFRADGTTFSRSGNR